MPHHQAALKLGDCKQTEEQTSFVTGTVSARGHESNSNFPLRASGPMRGLRICLIGQFQKMRLVSYRGKAFLGLGSTPTPDFVSHVGAISTVWCRMLRAVMEPMIILLPHPRRDSFELLSTSALPHKELRRF